MPRINTVEYLAAAMTGKLNGASCSNGDMVKICDVMIYAREVMDKLESHGAEIVPHLMDTDENAGQRLREALKAAEDIEFVPIIK